MKTTQPLNTTPALIVEIAGVAYPLYTLAQANAIVKALHAATSGSRLTNHAAYKDVYIKCTAEETAASGWGQTEKAIYSSRKVYTDSRIIKANPAARNLWEVTRGVELVAGL